MTLLTVKGLTKSFGGVTAVDDVDFELQVGEILALIGPNGAGKSTMFNLLNGQLKPDAGSIVLDGQRIVGQPPRKIWRLGVGRTFQIAQTFASMTIQENVQMALLSAHGKAADVLQTVGAYALERTNVLIEQVGLSDKAQCSCATLAYSDLKRVELAMAIAHQPSLLLMDEPTAGMAPSERHRLMTLVKQLAAEQKMAVLFTEHSMDVVFAYADRVMVLARGRLIANGSPQAIRGAPELAEVYFGTGASFEALPTEQVVVPNSLPNQSAAIELLTVQGLCAWHDQAQTLFNIDLSVSQGEVIALMGRNGAGKSTTMKAMMGLMARRTGSVKLRGEDISNLTTHQIAMRGIGFVPEDRRIFTGLTVLENLETGRKTARQVASDCSSQPVAWTQESLFALFPNLAEMPNRLGGQMSGGEQQMLTVARTLMGNPCLILLDEPSEGISPVIAEQMISAILRLKALGVGILLSEQNMRFAELVADRVYVLDHGSVCFAGSMNELLQNPEVQRTSLSL